jgi:hypothetical protein
VPRPAAATAKSITLTSNSSAHNLSPNTYVNSVNFNNTTNNQGSTTRVATLTVNPVPMLQAGRKPHNVPGPHFLDAAAFALHAAESEKDHECLAERVRVPCRARTGLKRHHGTANPCRIGRVE